MLKTMAVVALMTMSSTATLADPSPSADLFPISGTYLENQICKGDGFDPADKFIKITPEAIDSSFGLCTLHDKRRDGSKITAQVICKDPAGGALTSDITFTIRDERTLDFADQYETYKATLHKCPQ